MDINGIEKERPSQLNFLCILSFIGGGVSLLLSLLFFSLFDQIKMHIENGTFQHLLGDEMDMGFIVDINPDFFLWRMLLFAASVYGVYLMWNLKMTGFHIYSVSQILLLILPEIYVPSLPFPLLDISLTVLFILFYFKNLKEIEKE